jgi:hypothetical protein
MAKKGKVKLNSRESYRFGSSTATPEKHAHPNKSKLLINDIIRLQIPLRRKLIGFFEIARNEGKSLNIYLRDAL